MELGGLDVVEAAEAGASHLASLAPTTGEHTLPLCDHNLSRVCRSAQLLPPGRAPWQPSGVDSAKPMRKLLRPP